jgi:hypothetical protein
MNGLRIQAHQDLKVWERLFGAGFAAAAVGIPCATLLKDWWPIPSAIAAIAAFMLAKNTTAELYVTNVEFIARGNLGRRVKTPRIVCTADVWGLEFWSANPFGSQRDGLYAVTKTSKRYLLLPFLDFQQTKEAIGAIESKFPGLAQYWREKRGTMLQHALREVRTDD